MLKNLSVCVVPQLCTLKYKVKITLVTPYIAQILILKYSRLTSFALHKTWMRQN